MIHTDKTDGQIKLKEIVLTIMEDEGIERRWWKNLLSWTIRGYSDLNLYHLDYYEEAKLTPSDLNIITVPDDFVSLIALGMPYMGRFWRLNSDGRFITTTTTDGGSEVLDEEVGEGVPIGDGTYYHYGETGGKNAYSITWINATQFMINGTPRIDVIMRYVSSGVKQRGETFVPALCREVLVAGTKVKYLERINASDVKVARAIIKYDGELEKIRLAQFASVEDMMSAVYEAWSQAVKR